MPDLQLLNIQEGRLQAKPDLIMTFDNAGRFASGPTFISGTNVVVQDVIRALLTLATSNRLAPNFGTSLVDLLNSRSIGEISGFLTEEARKALGYLAQLRSEDDASEQITEIVNMKAKQNERTVEIELTVRAANGETATVTLS